MVLKKSNSSLNTGATQKVTRGGFYNAFDSRYGGEVENSVSISLERHSGPEDRSTQIEECLEMVQVYLNWHVTNLSHILGGFDTNRPRFHISSRVQGNDFSLNKGNSWDLATRISNMMKDIDFLRDLPSDIDLTYTKVSPNPTVSRVRKTIRASDILKAHEVKQTEKSTQTSKSRRRKTCHQRGVQRRHCLRPNDATTEEVIREGEAENKTIINITLYLPFKVDARSSKATESFDGYKGRKGKPSSFPKRKGFVNGTRSEGRVYHHELNKMLIYYKAEIDHMLYAACSSPQESTHETHDFLDLEEEEYDNRYSAQPISYSLEDLIDKPPPLRNEVKNRSNKHCSDISHNESIFDKPRHAKGSNLFIDDVDADLNKSWAVLDFAEDTSSSPSLDAGYESHVFENASDHEIEMQDYFGASLTNSNVQEDTERVKDIENFEKSFTRVHTTLPGDGVSLFPETLDQLQLETGPLLMVSNSLPHSFCVFPTIRNARSYVVGRRASKDGKVWEFSLQGSSLVQQADFTIRLSSVEVHDEPTPLTKLIDISREVLDCEIPSDIQDFDSAIVKSHNLTRPGHLAWADVTRWSKSLKFHTRNDALEIISQNTSTVNGEAKGAPESHMSNTSGNSMSSPTEVSECGVCLSPCTMYDEKENSRGLMLCPCRHFYCVDCWREHIFQSLKCGSQQVTCMAHNCSTLVDDATLRSVVPDKVVNNWRDRLRDRQLETSTFCKWCPAPKCELVALSSGTPLQRKFGRPVICPCGQLWCGACQAEPHWPASCDQMAAYRAILAKTRLHVYELERSVTFSIMLKPCPKCKYPIEKNEGCPSMVCRMCWYNFCWNCLSGTDNHNVYSCKVSPTSNFTTYSLTNNLVCDISVKYFMDGVAMSNKLSKLREQLAWAQTIRQTQQSKYRRLTAKLLCRTSQENIEKISFQLVDETVAFLHKAYALTETFYVLMSFAWLNKVKSTGMLVKSVAKTISRLMFLTDRLSTHVLGRSLPRIFQAEKTVRVLLKSGDSILDEMRSFGASLQHASKDVDTAWVADIDPKKHLRYK